MTMLRVLLDAAPAAERAADWALFAVSGRLVRTGRGRPSEWPPRDRTEAVIAAACGRLVTLTLPPLPPPRVAAAAAYALEDQLAGAPEDSHAAFGPQAADGTVRGAIVSASWMRAFAAGSQRAGIRWDRVVLESDLARPPASGWCWCASSISDAGFVVTDRGASIGVGAARDAGIPSELALAITAAGQHAPRVVRVDIGGIAPDRLAQAQAQTGVAFTAGTPWRWLEATPQAFASAVDLATTGADAGAPSPRSTAMRLFRPALVIAALALGIHVMATLGQWAWLQWQIRAVQRDLVALAQIAAPDSAATMPPLQAIGRREAELRHRAGLPARDDFIPLLARAAPALATLPADSVRSLRYADGHIVLELQKSDAAQTARVQRELQARGLTAIAAATATGARLRLGLD
ncbi:MAG TPA: type II secretion system protein GspL [Casimicrobiaceae bacterium]|nr:type II secretion system protein GspL [Casimicrobiaceae bacterium]